MYRDDDKRYNERSRGRIRSPKEIEDERIDVRDPRHIYKPKYIKYDVMLEKMVPMTEEEIRIQKEDEANTGTTNAYSTVHTFVVDIDLVIQKRKEQERAYRSAFLLRENERESYD